ncbi:hypothetical protein L226DRAFT_574675 [Lentinus tigrinus ALCF2SS1-7]|nr:hypothetical protein L226DRAFT_574675 [Lentinus tigrinus ALCF2SS1-7]
MKPYVASWLASQHWPVLEMLHVTCLPNPDILPTPVNFGFTVKHAPTLRALRLAGDTFRPPVERSLYSYLSILRLCRCEWPIPFRQFLDMLKCMTNIEVLQLDGVFLNMVGVPETRPAPLASIVTLPHLHSLTMEYNAYLPTTRILDSLYLPAAASVTLMITSSNEQDPERPIAASLPQDRSRIFPMFNNVTSLLVEADVYGQPCGLRGAPAADSRMLTMMFDSSMVDLSDTLSDTAKLFCNAPITTLNVCGYSLVDETAWIDVFESFPGLEVVNARDCEPETIHPFWTALGRTPSSSDSSALYCPRLRLVDTTESHTASPTEEEFWVMPRVLRARKERGHMLQELHLYHDFYMDDDRLGEYLAQVEESVGVLK